MCAACTDLVDAPYSDGLSMSRDDLKFMNIVENSVQCADGHYKVSLPLRNRNVKMPANRSQAERSASTSNASFPVIRNFARTMLLSLKRLSVQVMQRRFPKMFGIDWLVRYGLFHTTVSTIIRSRIKFACFQLFPTVSWHVSKQQAIPRTRSIVPHFESHRLAQQLAFDDGLLVFAMTGQGVINHQNQTQWVDRNGKCVDQFHSTGQHLQCQGFCPLHQ